MTDPRLDSMTTVAIVGAERLDDDELAAKWQSVLDRVIVRRPDDQDHAQDLCDVAAVAMVKARRLMGSK